MKNIKWMIYGANGYTGALTARIACEQGILPAPILAGRTEHKVRAVAEPLGLEVRIAGLGDDDSDRLAELLEDIDVVLHCAGPFSRTARPMAKACLKTGTHYLDITGEIGVFEALQRMDGDAQSAEIMLMPGAGFDVVPTDCIALHLAQRLPSANKLFLGFSGGAGSSRGTRQTMMENLHQPSCVRRGGRIQPIKIGSLTREIDFGRGPKLSMAIPWGDVSTAHWTTGIPDIEVYTRVSKGILRSVKALRKVPWLTRSAPIQAFLKRRGDKLPPGPSDAQREKAKSYIWGRVEAPDGQSAEVIMTTPEGYTLTALTSLEIVGRVLKGEAPIGYQTPAKAYGADLITTIAGVTRVGR